MYIYVDYVDYEYVCVYLLGTKTKVPLMYLVPYMSKSKVKSTTVLTGPTTVPPP
jgi:hypothetical protein